MQMEWEANTTQQTVELPKATITFYDRPTDYEYAALCEAVYETDGGEKKKLLPKGWKVVKILDNSTGGYWELALKKVVAPIFINTTLPLNKTGYLGALYHSSEKNLLVLANSGTKDSQDWIKVNIPQIILQQIHSPSQMADVYRFTNYIRELCTQYPNCRLSITGHSLGGWLAAISVLFFELAQRQNTEHHPMPINAVTFDNPGTKEILTKLQERIIDASHKVDLDYLDLVSYLSWPNPVNTLGTPLGTTYQLCPSKSTHSMAALKALFNSEHGRPENALKVIRWPHGWIQFSVPSHLQAEQGSFKQIFGDNYMVEQQLTSRIKMRNFPLTLQDFLYKFYENHKDVIEDTSKHPSIRNALKRETNLDDNIISFLLGYKIYIGSNKVKSGDDELEVTQFTVEAFRANLVNWYSTAKEDVIKKTLGVQTMAGLQQNFMRMGDVTNFDEHIGDKNKFNVPETSANDKSAEFLLKLHAGAKEINAKYPPSHTPTVHEMGKVENYTKQVGDKLEYKITPSKK